MSVGFYNTGVGLCAIFMFFSGFEANSEKFTII